MSADNYWLIRKDKFGLFVPVMGFESNNENPIIRSQDKRYTSFELAVNSIKDEWTEYGIRVHDECWSESIPKYVLTEHGHFPGCSYNYVDLLAPEDLKCSCEVLKETWDTFVEPVHVFVATTDEGYNLPKDGWEHLRMEPTTDPISDKDWVRHAYNRGSNKHMTESDHFRHLRGLEEVERTARLREQFLLEQ